jgi:predicted membrane channel-forming protein YqfA (hemolysin III family)
MEWVLTRPSVITLAVVGGVFSLIGTVLRKRQGQERTAAKMDTAAYVFMGLSILIFIIIGVRGQEN